MAIHNQKFKEYQSYPGRQIEYTVVPRKYPHYFFEGVQSVDATANSTDVNHGQFGFKSDVIIEKEYTNTTGSVSLKEFNNASYVLRGMMGANPASTFVFDPSRIEHVDVCANVFNKARNKVLRSHWLVDFVPSLSENESLDDIQTKDLNYTAVRKIDFENYQIIHQEWMDADDETYGAAKKGAKDFILKYPAVIDPVIAEAYVDPTDKYSKGQGQVIGKVRHELCPIQFMLRVIVNGQVLDDPSQAVVTTTVVGDTVVSKLHLTEGLPEDGTPVIAFWLYDGNHPIGSSAITTAPVIAEALPQTFDITASGTEWDNILEVRFSEAIRGYENFWVNSGTWGNFELKVITKDHTGAVTGSYNVGSPSIINGADATVPDTVSFAEGTTGAQISRNLLKMDFTNSSALPAFTWTGADVTTDTGTIEWYLSYKGDTSGMLPLSGEDTKELVPVQTIKMVTTIDAADGSATTVRVLN